MAECQLPKLNTRVRFPSPAPQKRTSAKQMSFFVDSAGWHPAPPFGIELLGLAKPSLRRGFACGKTLVRCTRANRPKASSISSNVPKTENIHCNHSFQNKRQLQKQLPLVLSFSRKIGPPVHFKTQDIQFNCPSCIGANSALPQFYLSWKNRGCRSLCGEKLSGFT